uniref:Putative lipid exporter abca1 n=1 Tax=Ixodes ricinus TaxID=34613 RepID=A0A147BM79_IXORI
MSFWDQLGLLLWKNFVVHRRQKVRLLVELVWPLLLFFILMWVRTRGLRLYMHQCHFEAKAMPSAGLLAFVQSTVCTLNNTCHQQAVPDGNPQELNTSLVAQLVRDVQHLVRDHLGNPDTADSIQRLSGDLETLSAFVRKLTDPDFPLIGKVAVADVLRARGTVEAGFASAGLSDVYPAFLGSSIGLAAVQKLFDRGKEDVGTFLCGPGGPVLLEAPGQSAGVQEQLCKLPPEQGRTLATLVLSGLDWELATKQVASVAAQNGHPLRPSDWAVALSATRALTEEVRRLEGLRQLLGGLSERVAQLGALVGGPPREGRAMVRLVQGALCGRNSSVLLEPERSPDHRVQEFSEKVTRNMQQRRTQGASYVYDNTTSPRCNEVFRSLEENQLSRFVWRQLKPFVRGKILFAPDSPATRTLVHKVNATFEATDRVMVMARRWSQELAPRLGRWLGNRSSTLQQLGRLASSAGLGALLVGQAEPTQAASAQEALSWLLGDWDSHLQRLDAAALAVQRALECVEGDRLEGFPSEESLLARGQSLMREDKLWAALVFPGLEGVQELPPFVRYKIRMDARKVDSTKRTKDRIQSPGPRRRPAMDLKYLTFGFAYLQDLVEHALVALHTGREAPGVYLQQFPYPCYIFDQFIATISESFPMFMVLSWVYWFAMLVKGLVREKELRLKEAMRATGLATGPLWAAWLLDALALMLTSSLLLACILKFGRVLDHSDFGVVFSFLACYGVAAACQAFLVAGLFSRANVAAAAGGILFFTCYLPYPLIRPWKHTLGFKPRLALCLLPNVAFGLGCSQLAHLEEEGVGVHWGNLSQGSLPPSTFSLAHVMGMLLWDALLCFLLAWYLEGVCPGQYGVPRPWYFPLSRSYWCGSSARRGSHSSARGAGSTQHGALSGGRPEDFEEEPRDLPLGVSLHELTKRYPGARRPAVDGLSLNFYQGQITSFLGHNGAGKTTTMSILTGLYPPTSGTAFICGRDVRSEMDAIRRSLGTCPQHNVLFDDLTVAEHLWFFGRLKGLGAKEAAREADAFLRDLSLEHRRHQFPGQLSGGLRRKLSVSLAFVGGSRTVLLDEPTAGVDPHARRSIWDLLLRLRDGRTVIMSTHHMDEADLLGDRIAVIAEGRLRCCGSSMFLKTRFGSGYYLTLVRGKGPVPRVDGVLEDPFDDAATSLSSLMRQHLGPGVEPVTHQGADLCYRLPPGAPLAALCEQLDAQLPRLGLTGYGISDTSLEEVFLRVTQGTGAGDNPKVDGAAPGDPGESLEPPRSKLKEALGSLIAWCASLGKPRKGTDQEEAACRQHLDPSRDAEPPRAPVATRVATGMHRRQLAAMYRRRLTRSSRNYRGLFCEIVLPALFVLLALVCTLVVPPLSEEPPLELSPRVYGPPNYVFFSNEDPSSPLARKYTESLLSPPGLGHHCVQGESPPRRCEIPAGAPVLPKGADEVGEPGLCGCSSGSQQCSAGVGGPPPPALRSVTGDVLLNVTGRNVSDWLLRTWRPYHMTRFGGVQFGVGGSVAPLNLSALEEALSQLSLPQGWNVSGALRALRQADDDQRHNVKVWFNNEGWVSSAAYMNAVNNVLLRAQLPPGADVGAYGVAVVNHPMNFTRAQLQDELLKRGGLSLLHATCVIFAMSFVPASFVMFLIEDRVSGSQHLQFVSGMKPLLYWVGTYTWDLCNYAVSALLCILIFLAFKEDAYVSSENIGGLVLLLLLYGWSSIPLMYPASFAFEVPSSAFVALACLNVFVGLVSTVSTYVLELFDDEELRAVSRVLRKAFLVLPQYCLGRGLMDMFANHLAQQALARFGLQAMRHPLEWDFLGQNLVGLACQGLVFFPFTLLLQHGFFLSRKQPTVAPINGELSDEDEDVVRERARVLSGQADDSVLKVEGLTKVYRRDRRPAVDRLCVGVGPGECFGLLGVNGAGKTSTFRMLTGDTPITGGDAHVSGFSVRTQLDQARQNVGYCPQSDALDPLLTGWEHLQFYARLRGFPEKRVSQLADWGLRQLGLQRWAHQCAGTYSGGNKRKLSTAIALLGEPPLVFLDEPTTGMDPKSRRLFWDSVRDVVRDGRSVVLTSHSMEECEALCSRLAIMVNGRFRCLGSIQHLKNKYGQGYTATLRVQPGAQARLGTLLGRLFCPGELVLGERHLGQLEYRVSPRVAPASLFRRLEELREECPLDDYSVTQTTLDQVFVHFAKQQGDGEPAGTAQDLPPTPPHRRLSRRQLELIELPVRETAIA